MVKATLHKLTFLSVFACHVSHCDLINKNRLWHSCPVIIPHYVCAEHPLKNKQVYLKLYLGQRKSPCNADIKSQ